MAGWAGSYLPPLSSRSEFYSTSLSLVLIRCGVMTAGLAVAWLWMRRPTAQHWSPLALLGRTSLFVYLVHIQLAYGLFSAPLHHALSLPAALVVYALLTIVMLGTAADWWEKRGRGPWIATGDKSHVNLEFLRTWNSERSNALPVPDFGECHMNDRREASHRRSEFPILSSKLTGCCRLP